MILKVAGPGRVDYAAGLALQNRLVERRRASLTGDVLLVVEHPPVLTIGRTGSRANIVVSGETLAAEGVAIHEVNRGGDVTYHGPGQIVGYPIIDLARHGRDLLAYMRGLEEVFIRLLAAEYGVEARRDARYPGVWVGDEKITAVGVAVVHWVTMHGFAFNVNTNLAHFAWINPCGITDKGVTSLEKVLGRPQDMEAAGEQVVRYFCRQFGYSPEYVRADTLFAGGPAPPQNFRETGWESRVQSTGSASMVHGCRAPAAGT